MAMKIRLLKNIFKQGWQGIWRNKGMGVASVSSISAVLMILGMVLILILSINSLVVDTKTKFDEIEVFLKEDIDNNEMGKIEEVVRNREGVVSIIFKSKDEALRSMKEGWGDEAYILEGLEGLDNNPLPDSYIIKLRDVEYADGTVDSIKDIRGIEKINYHKDIIDKLMVVANYIRVGGITVIGVLIFVSIFIISNTIKLTVTSRKREIGIMKYVGATNAYIRGPFILEGVFFGLIGAIFSIIIVYFGYGYFFQAVNEKLYSMISIILVPPVAIFEDITIIFLAIGAGIGALGSLISMKRFLNV